MFSDDQVLSAWTMFITGLKKARAQRIRRAEELRAEEQRRAAVGLTEALPKTRTRAATLPFQAHLQELGNAEAKSPSIEKTKIAGAPAWWSDGPPPPPVLKSSLMHRRLGMNMPRAKQKPKRTSPTSRETPT